MNESKFRPEEINLVRDVLEPGDNVLELCKFIVDSPTIGVLTNQSLHLMAFRKTWRGSLEMTSHSTVPLSKISTITTSKKSKAISITFWWEGKEENLRSVWVNEATEFADRLKHLVATKETAQGTLSMADEIAKLSRLADEGILSQDELVRAKELFLGQPRSNIDESIQLLRNLHELQKKGVLSESEFNMKKWDVLSKKDFQ